MNYVPGIRVLRVINKFQRIYAFGRGDGLRAQLVRGAVGVGGLKLLSVPLTLAVSILLARGLGPEGYGKYVFVMAVISLLALPIGPGLGQLITREVAKYHHGKDWSLIRGLLRRAHQWVLVGSVVMLLTIAGVAARQAEWRMDDRWALHLVAALMLPLLGLNAVRSSTLRGLRHVFYAQLPELLARPCLHLVIAGTLLAVGMLNPATALASQITATGLGFAIGAWLLWRRRPPEVVHARPEYRNREWGAALLPFTLLVAISTFNIQIGIVAVGWLSTDAEVAALRVALSGSLLVSMPLAIINQVIAPHITRAYRDNDTLRMARLFRQSALTTLAIATPIALPLIFFGKPIVGFAFGKAYLDSVSQPLAVLAVGQLINVAFGSVGLFLTMSGFHRLSLYGGMVGLTICVALMLALVPNLGAVGAAIAYAVALAVVNISHAYYVGRKLRLKLFL